MWDRNYFHVTEKQDSEYIGVLQMVQDQNLNQGQNNDNSRKKWLGFNCLYGFLDAEICFPIWILAI